MDEDECFNKFCNGGVCVNIVGSYKCLCKLGMIGKDCEVLMFIVCYVWICYYYGICYVVDDYVVCFCNKGFYGIDCLMYDYCVENLCKYGGVCLFNKYSYVC